MTKRLCVLAILFSFVSSNYVFAEEYKPRLAELSIQPAAAPVPSLQYLLYPDPADQTLGNAEPLLSIATDFMHEGKGAYERLEKVKDWLDMPVDQVPREETVKLFETYKHALSYAKLASRREWCHGDISFRTEGYDALLPSLYPIRNIARLLALQVRLDISEGKFDEALDNLQTGYGIAGHLGTGPTLIQSLVGASIVGLMNKQIEYWIDTPGSPNLYWALTDLPKPLVNVGKCLRMDRSILYWEYPELSDMKKRVMTEEEVDSLIGKLVNQLLSWTDGEESREKEQKRYDKMFSDSKRINEIYGQAKKHLISQGCPLKLVQAMPVKQVVMIYSLERYKYWRDELFKWHGLPYYQIEAGYDDAEKRFGRARKNLAEGEPFNGFLASLKQASFMMTGMARDIEALRCIEAIRMYAADNNGKLPASLGDITQVPVPPIDPITGKAFVYRLKGNTAILESIAPKSAKESDSIQYRLTIAR